MSRSKFKSFRLDYEKVLHEWVGDAFLLYLVRHALIKKFPHLEISILQRICETAVSNDLMNAFAKHKKLGKNCDAIERWIFARFRHNPDEVVKFIYDMIEYGEEFGFFDKIGLKEVIFNHSVSEDCSKHVDLKIEFCPNCNSSQIYVKKGGGTVTCNACEFEIVYPHGLNSKAALIYWNREVLSLTQPKVNVELLLDDTSQLQNVQGGAGGEGRTISQPSDKRRFRFTFKAPSLRKVLEFFRIVD